MNVMKIATVPPPAIPQESTIKNAIPALVSRHGCALAVMDGSRIVGTICSDDVLTRAIGAGLDPETATAGEIMTSPPATVCVDTDSAVALRWMLEHRQCYLGIVDPDGNLKGWLSICNLFEEHVSALTNELDSLAAYVSADGPGG